MPNLETRTKNDLVKKDDFGFGQEWQVMKEQANMLIKSKFMPPSITTPEQAIMVAMAGRELGIGFMESIRSINVIQGKPTISPQLMLALANRTGEVENIEILATDDGAKVTIKRKGRSPFVTEFGMKEATDLQLIGKDNYKKQKKTMFTWRALAANLRITFPDVVLGLYTPEEVGADVHVNENGTMEIIEARTITEDVPRETERTLLTMDQRAELFRIIKDKQVNLAAFKEHLKSEYGVEKTDDVRASDFSALVGWVNRQAAQKK